MSSQRELVIEANKAEQQYWRDLWIYRELLYFLSWRDVVVRYKQTAIGVVWAVIRPLLTIVVFTVVFGRIAQLPSGGVPYPVLVAVGMLPWQFFSTALSEASGSLVNNASLVSKVYFPRLILPTSAVLTSLVDFLITFVCTILLMVAYGIVPDARVLALPLFTLIAFGTAIGAGLWLAALNAQYRDFRYIIPFIMQLGLYVSPVGFSSTEVPDRWRLLYSVNPMVGVIDGFRWAMLGDQTSLYIPGLVASSLLCVSLLVSGILFFRKMERTFADVI